jgi:hypothetical protein
MDIDIIINVISKTLFSPQFCAFIPLSFYGQVRSFWHPTVYLSTAWLALVIVVGKCSCFVIADPQPYSDTLIESIPMDR